MPSPTVYVDANPQPASSLMSDVVDAAFAVANTVQQTLCFHDDVLNYDTPGLLRMRCTKCLRLTTGVPVGK